MKKEETMTIRIDKLSKRKIIAIAKRKKLKPSEYVREKITKGIEGDND